MTNKNLGHATAYAYYKAGGGTMTEAEFTEFMADFGTASQTAVEAARAALASETAAQTAATTATNKASEATTAATTATTKAGEASTSASTATSAKDTAVSASQTATTKATEATTAAATATSAKDDAVSANTAAQSAKTAAQTAQTGAETAAASVAESAAQIQTNAEDISQLKNTLETTTGTSEIEFTKGYAIILNTSPISLTPVTASGFKYANIECAEGDTFTINGIGAGSAYLYAFLDADNNLLQYLASAGVEQFNLVVTAPANTVRLIVNNYISNTEGVKSYKGLTDLSVRVKELEESTEAIEPLKTAVGYQKYSFTDGEAILTPAKGGTANLTPSAVGSVSYAIIDCSEGDVFTLSGTPRSNSGTRPYMFIDSNNVVLFRSDETAPMESVPIVAPVNSAKLIVNFLLNQPKSVHAGYEGISNRLAEYFAFKNEPLTNLPSYFVNNMGYKPIGSLDKGYVCLSCDDGAVDLATYTIPMIIAKNVPCTFSLWSTSAVLTDYSATVVDAITNHNCELAQHGNQIWAEENGDTAFTEARLNEFFDTEKAFWDTLGIVPKCAVCPAHYNNPLVRSVAGGRFGVVRSGLDYVENHYTYYSSGARSNLFGVSSQNINGGSLEYWKAAIDYAYENHKILNIYWHDWDLTNEQKTKLEAVIDYAKTKGIAFCTVGEIANVL